MALSKNCNGQSTIMSSDGSVTENLHQTWGKPMSFKQLLHLPYDCARRREIILYEKQEQKQIAFIPI